MPSLPNLIHYLSSYQSGSHRQALEEVILHYQKDSLKLRAVYFLITHMPQHGTYNSDQKKVYDSALFNHLAHLPDTLVANLSFTNPLVNLLIDSLDSVYGRLSTIPLEKKSDIRTIPASYLIQHIDQAFTAWKTQSWAQKYDFNQFCEYILPYRVANEALEDWRTPMIKKFHWLHDSLGNNFSVNKACSVINRHLQLTSNIAFGRYPVAQPLSSIQKGRMGNCQEQVDLALFAMRSLGLAVAHDFTPIYANYHAGHGWNALITPQGETHDFMGTFRDLSQHYLWWKAAKVYRQMYSSQSTFPFNVVDKSAIPPFFRNSTVMDVTAEYFPVSDITVQLSSSNNDLPNVAYLCTFGDREWYPIHWGNVTNQHSVTFTDMGRGYQSEDTALLAPVADDLLYYTQIDAGEGIAYTPMSYENGQLSSIGSAFVLSLEGDTKPLAADTTQKQTLVLRRKYPETLRKQGWRQHMVGGSFQGANRADFSDAKDLFTISKVPGEYIVTETFDNTGKFQYVRFLMNEDTINSVAEFAFYGQDDQVLTGHLIYDGEFSTDGPPERAVDNNPLTFAEGISTIKYIGWKLQQPTSIQKITYLARNDGNAVQIDDRYELLYWNQQWISLGKTVADTTLLTYPETPTNALFWLRNLSRGREERIFTYEEGKQIWW